MCEWRFCRKWPRNGRFVEHRHALSCGGILCDKIIPRTTPVAAFNISEGRSSALSGLKIRDVCDKIIRSNKGVEGQYVTVARPLGSKRTAPKAECLSVSDWKARLKRD